MPHIIGAVDGKHVRIKCPKNTGSLYYNYKWFFSLVLQAISDANYGFALFDVGQYDSNNDSGALIYGYMGGYFEDLSNHILQLESVERCGFEIYPLRLG